MPAGEPAERAARGLGQRKIDRLDHLAGREHRSSRAGEEIVQRQLPRAAVTDEFRLAP